MWNGWKNCSTRATRSHQKCSWRTASSPVVPFKGWQVKILGDGEITKALTVRVHRVTATAREKIIAAGGTVEETAADSVEETA